MCGI
ncbi:tyrosine-specific transport protein, partial [Vibrio parahaemolyticus V-223/04]|jgi:uncharacterized protein (DUF2345 family)